MRQQANNFQLDGIDNNDGLVNSIVFFPPVEATQEFRVNTSMAPAEFGKAGVHALGIAIGERFTLVMRPGEILEVITTDPMSVVDMPVFCAQAGHDIVREIRGDGHFVFVIERGPIEGEST